MAFIYSLHIRMFFNDITIYNHVLINVRRPLFQKAPPRGIDESGAKYECEVQLWSMCTKANLSIFI